MKRMQTYFVSAAIMLALDLAWLGLVSPPLYRSMIGPLMRPNPDLVAAALFYAIYILHLGLPKLMATPNDKAIPFTCVIAVAMFLLFIMTGWFGGSI